MNVLIAEDESATRMRLERNLEKLGFTPTAAENGAEAWKLYQEGEFPLVLTDWMMPEMDGLELVRKDPRQRSTAIHVRHHADVGRVKRAKSLRAWKPVRTTL